MSDTKFKPNDPRLIGNKFALGNTTGRPRTTTPEPQELEKLGQEMLQWATEPTEELRYHLNQWYCLKLGISHADFELMKDKSEFHPYYERAKIAIARRYVDSSIAPAIAQRFIRHYFPEVKQDEDEVADKKNKANSQALNAEEFIKAIREDMNARSKEQSIRGISPAPGPEVATE